MPVADSRSPTNPKRLRIVVRSCCVISNPEMRSATVRMSRAAGTPRCHGLLSNRGNEGVGIAARADQQDRSGLPLLVRLLVQGQIGNRHRFLQDRAKLDAFDDADDLADIGVFALARQEPDSFAEGVLVRPVPPGHDLVDDDDLRRVGAVLGGEDPSRQQGLAERLEIPGAYTSHTPVDLRPCGRRSDPSMSITFLPPPDLAHGRTDGQTGRCHAGQSAHALPEVLHETAQVGPVQKPTIQVQPHDEDLPRVIAGIGAGAARSDCAGTGR